MSRPKHQHYVPQFYLRHFAIGSGRDGNGSAPQVWYVDKNEVSGPQRTAIRNICGKRYLYTPLDAHGERDWSVEEFLGKLEARAQTHWPALANGAVDVSNPIIRRDLAEFVAALHLRNEAIKTLIARMMETRDKLRLLPEDDQPPHDGLDARDPARFFAQQLRRSLPNISQALEAKRWAIAIADHDAFVTSDKPVMFMRPGYRLAGPGTPDTFVMLAVGPQRVLIMDDRSDIEPNTSHFATDNFIELFNKETHKRSTRFTILGSSPRAIGIED